MGVIRSGLVSAAIISTLSLQSGCSFLFVKGPPANHEQMAMFDCSDSNAWPVVDLVWAGLNGLGAASAAGDETNPDQDQIVGVGVAWLVVSGISAIYGFGKVSSCNDAKRLRDEQMGPRRIAAPPPLTTPAPAATPAMGAAPMHGAPGVTPAAAPAPAAAPVPAPAAAPAAAPMRPPTQAPAPAEPGTAPVSMRPSPSRSLAMRTAPAVD